MLEEMVAAGWIPASDLDEDYQEHIKAHGEIDYGDWKHMRSELGRLNALYEAEVAPYYTREWNARIPDKVEKRGDNLMRQMVQIEAALGY